MAYLTEHANLADREITFELDLDADLSALAQLCRETTSRGAGRHLKGEQRAWIKTAINVLKNNLEHAANEEDREQLLLLWRRVRVDMLNIEQSSPGTFSNTIDQIHGVLNEGQMTWRVDLSLWLKKAFEYALDACLKHCNLVAQGLHEKINALRPHTMPSEIGILHEFKNLVNAGAHSGSVDCDAIVNSLFMFQKAISIARKILSTPPNKNRRTFKRAMCRNWEKYGDCRYGSECAFAHGQNEIQRD